MSLDAKDAPKVMIIPIVWRFLCLTRGVYVAISATPGTDIGAATAGIVTVR